MIFEKRCLDKKSVLIKEVRELIMQLPGDIDPSDLVGKRILHKFIVDGDEEKWFHGKGAQCCV